MKIFGKWALAFLYVLAIFTVTPYLPKLIQIASYRWSSESVIHFVLSVEIIIALLILVLGIILLVFRKKKTALFFIIFIGGIFLMSFVLYFFLPNPYEFTHLPEYAILSFLIMRALDKNTGKGRNSSRENGKIIGDIRRIKEKKENVNSGRIKNYYFLNGIITGIIGAGDEIYQYFLPNRFFTWYDVFFNILGGILGLLIFWGIKK